MHNGRVCFLLLLSEFRCMGRRYRLEMEHINTYSLRIYYHYIIEKLGGARYRYDVADHIPIRLGKLFAIRHCIQSTY